MLNRKPLSPEAMRLKMADLCARSEQCEHDIREKLRRKMLRPDDIDNIIGFLIERKFIDNARFARSFTNDKVRFAGWGRNKIRRALALKRIPTSLISEAFEEIDENEYYDALLKAAASKARSLRLEEYDDRLRLFRHLFSRGFESPLISKAIASIRKQQQ